MLQSHSKQLLIKYMTGLRQCTELPPEDLGSVRTAMSMALEELQNAHRQQLADMDDIAADLLHERDTLEAMAVTDADEILRLQTMEDRLTQWVSRHVKIDADGDIASVVIDLLSKQGGAVVAPPSTNGNGHVDDGKLDVRFRGRRLNISDDELYILVIDTIRHLAAMLGHAPCIREWVANMGPNTPTLPTITARLKMKWSELVAAAGMPEQEAGQDDAEAPFRGG